MMWSMSCQVHLFLLLTSHLLQDCLTSQVERCCRRRGVSSACARTLCNPSNPPDDFAVYNMFERKANCLPHMNVISECLADGRDHMHCCQMEAEDRDENACFGICRGEGIDDVTAWDKYQTCLAINLVPMFKCFEQGYIDTPSAPLGVQVLSIATHSVILSWSSPSVNAHLADSYRVLCKEVDGELTETELGTTEMTVTINGLKADSKYSASVIAVGRDDHHQSLPSEVIYFSTAGIAPQVTAYRHLVQVPKRSHSATLVCQMQMPGTIHRNADVEWKKMMPKSGRFETVTGDRYIHTNYMSSHGSPRYYISALQIMPLAIHDFGIYRCVASNDYGSSSSDIRLSIRASTQASAHPPESPQACCLRQGIRPLCASVCGTEPGKRVSLRPEAFMNNHCEQEMGKFLSCTAAGVEEGACCLRQRVPTPCIPLCDGSHPQSTIIPHICVPHTLPIFQCRMEHAVHRPAAVSGLRAVVQGESILLRWNATENAEMYHVYWRRRPSTRWELSSVMGINKRIVGADEVVVVASNSYGNAQPARLSYDHGKWICTYY
ncbi:hypothetical protein AB6A40_005860 [Gnathostoma spinigerum]|uniref:Uncharacterized protein n=1 Tax=Gnathostoma spinigerum TaxID=75299 RepID=A0ABD6ENZ3_9BILA